MNNFGKILLFASAMMFMAGCGVTERDAQTTEASFSLQETSAAMEETETSVVVQEPQEMTAAIEGKDCLAMEFDGEVLYWKKETARAENYEELIAAARECIVNQNSEVQLAYDLSPALLASYNHGTLGYLKKDLDGNGTEELLFGANDTGADGMPCTVLYHLYTISEEEPVSVLKGWERNRYYLCENGMIANEGSSGAADSEYSYFVYQGAELKLQEAVFYDGERDEENPWFYAAEPSGDAGSAQPISEEEAEEIRNSYVYQVLSLIPFEDETSTQTEEPISSLYTRNRD